MDLLILEYFYSLFGPTKGSSLYIYVVYIYVEKQTNRDKPE